MEKNSEKGPRKEKEKTTEAMRAGPYIRFDWAMKRLLRDKANYRALEGLLSSLLDREVTIDHLLESEGNQSDAEDKYNRVDIMAVDSHGERFIVEVQNNNETAYFQRMLFGTSKLVTDFIRKGDPYSKVVKVYSVNIVYFDLGKGRDVVYHGTTEFRGMRTNELLDMGGFRREPLGVNPVSRLYPEYYVLKVNNFDDVARTPLDEWIYYLKNGDLPKHASAPGLEVVRERLKVDGMTKDEQLRYERHVENLMLIEDQIAAGRMEGEWIGEQRGERRGREEGRQEGEERKTLEIARNLKAMGMPVESIMQATGLSATDIEGL